MSDLKPYVVFAETVAAGSMSAAARRLGMTPSAVSQILRALEQQTGVTLLHRSTRRLSLTEAGERCYPHCVRLIEAAKAAEASLMQARQDTPSGELRIAAPVGFGAHVSPALAPVLAEWPKLRLRLIVDDALIDLIDTRIDIALRVGRLPDSNWVAHPLCEFEPILCAAPAYLARHGWPESHADLPAHHWLVLERDLPDAVAMLGAAMGEAAPTVSIGFGLDAASREQIDVTVRTCTNNQIALQQMCEQGMGLARLYYADARQALEQGTLMRVLPRLRLTSTPVTLLAPSRDQVPAKTKIAIAALKMHFAKLGSASAAPP